MKKKYGLSFLLLLLFFQITSKNIAITCNNWPGRLGDHIFYITRCLMLSNKYNIPFYYIPLKPLKPFILHDTLPKLTPDIAQTFTKRIHIKHESYIPNYLKNNEDNILIVIGFHTKAYDNPHTYWRSSKERYDTIKSLLMPVDESALETVVIPENHISVAIHVRKGSGGDGHLASKQLYDYTPEWKIMCKKGLLINDQCTTFTWITPKTEPFKKIMRSGLPRKKITRGPIDKINQRRFPPDQYYIECIKKLSELLHHQPLYIQLFTDYAHPQELVEKYKNHVNLPNIIWHDSKSNNNYEQSVLKDLYAMTQFDCIIKGDSYFGWAAQFLGNHRITMGPNTAIWSRDTLIIKKIGIINFI